jgi:hypothetical protein
VVKASAAAPRTCFDVAVAILAAGGGGCSDARARQGEYQYNRRAADDILAQRCFLGGGGKRAALDDAELYAAGRGRSGAVNRRADSGAVGDDVQADGGAHTMRGREDGEQQRVKGVGGYCAGRILAEGAAR